MNLGVDPRHADQMVRGSVTLPNGTGKTVRVAVFARGAKADEAKEAGADIVGAEDLMETDPGRHDRVRPLHRHAGHDADRRPPGQNPGPAQPDAEPQGRHGDDGRRQGREGRAKGGEVQFRAEKAGVVHAGVGKASFDAAKLAENIRAFVDAVNRAKPTGAKGTYMKKVSLSSTMGPGVSVDAGQRHRAAVAGLSRRTIGISDGAGLGRSAPFACPWAFDSGHLIALRFSGRPRSRTCRHGGRRDSGHPERRFRACLDRASTAHSINAERDFRRADSAFWIFPFGERPLTCPPSGSPTRVAGAGDSSETVGGRLSGAIIPARDGK